MKLSALPYLKGVIQPIISEIVNFKRSCEVDPTRLEKNDDLAKNWKNLTTFCEVAFDSIMKSAAECPRDLCEVFHFLRTRVKEKFPSNEYVEYTAVSGFIFLRFFCPAILGPTLFGLWDGNDPFDPLRSMSLFLCFNNIVVLYLQSILKSSRPERSRWLPKPCRTWATLWNLATRRSS